MTSFSTSLFNIKLLYGGKRHLLPYATDNIFPTFSWELPDGIYQTAFIFEMRTVQPVLYSDGITFRCAYYSSPAVISSRTEHTPMFALLPETWQGVCEVRLRVYDIDGNIYSSHDRTNTEYDFEGDNPQWLMWGSTNDKYHFVFDENIDTFLNRYDVDFMFRRSTDVDEQDLTYQLQISETPLFGGGLHENLLQIDDIEIDDLDAIVAGGFQTERYKDKQVGVELNTLLPNTMYFVRARAFDGLDYSDWSIVNAFNNIANDPPIFHIWDVNANVDDRFNGEVEVVISIEDKDSDYVNAEFCFSMRVDENEANFLETEINNSDEAVDFDIEIEKVGLNKLLPAGFLENTTKLPTSKLLGVDGRITLTWLTGKQIVNTKKQSVFLYMFGADEYSGAIRDTYGAITIDNSTIGDINAGVSTSPERMRLLSDFAWYLHYPLLPDTSIRQVIKSDFPSGVSNPENKKITVSAKEWLDYWDAEYYDSPEDFNLQSLVHGDGKYTSYCPECTTLSELETIKVDNNTIKFYCRECEKLYDMSMRYQEHLSILTYGNYMKDQYALYHGYNSDTKKYLDRQLMTDLQFEDEIKQYHHSHYTLQDFKLLNQLALYNLVPRPEFDSYYHIIPPKSGFKHHVSYMDGQGLAMDVDEDYMFGYDSADESGNFNGDADMKKLSEQISWNILPELIKLYTGLPYGDEGDLDSGLSDDEQKPIVYAEDEKGIEIVTKNTLYGDVTLLWTIFNITISTNFATNIIRDVNDRYCIETNNILQSGSILDIHNIDELRLAYPYTEDGDGIWRENKYLNMWKMTLRELFPTDLFRFDETRRNNDNISIELDIYGIADHKLKQVRLLDCENSCYDDLGIKYFDVTQQYLAFAGNFSIYGNGLLRFGKLSNENDGKNYYYSLPNNKTPNYYCQESEIDNDLDFSVTAVGEPLFTCYKDEIDKNGHHFKYSEEDFKQTGKVFVRKAYVEPCNPHPNGKYGFRNWIIVPISDKPNRYQKKKVLHFRGLPSYTGQVPVKLDDNSDKIIYELGYFEAKNNTCISHYKKEPEDDFYFRHENMFWQNQTTTQNCICYEYVDISETLLKNYLDWFSYHPLNRKAPILIGGIIDLLNNHGLYMMGAYKKSLKQMENYNQIDENNFNFVVDEEQNKTLNCLQEDGTTKSISALQRYNDHWKDVIPVNPVEHGELKEVYVEQLNPSWYGQVGINLKYGYQPKFRVNDYWKLDEGNFFKNKYIPEDNDFVNEIYNEPQGDFIPNAEYQLQKYLISDKSNIPSDDEYTKEPYLDYRLTGKSVYEERKYFSGLPQDEHPAFQTRPQPPHPHDRPWRIVGEIRELDVYSNWTFLYLQNEWNAYNRVHWHVTQDENIYLCLYATRIKADGSTAEKFNVKTFKSIWVKEFSRWCIPFVLDEASDMIDTINNTNFIESERYFFSLEAINKYTGDISSSEIHSIFFTTSKTAISPATITNTEYNPWTKELTIIFRFDDSLGRKYDITGFQYSLFDEPDNPTGTWHNVELGNLIGRKVDLKSNRYGDNVPTRSMIVEHKIKVNVSSFSGVVATDSLRVRILSDIALNRIGLTMPIFSVKCWANEFILPAEKKILSLEGGLNRWVWREDRYDFATDTIRSGWEYLPEDKAVIIPGKLRQTQYQIDEINYQFEAWYSSTVKFQQMDLDGFELFLLNTDRWKQFYYVEFFNDFITAESLTDDYNYFLANYDSPKYQIVNQDFLEKYVLTGSYQNYYINHRLQLLKEYVIELKDEFASWFDRHKATDEIVAMTDYINADSELQQSFTDYWRENSTLSEAEAMTNLINDDNDLKLAFQQYFQQINWYLDSRYSERNNHLENLMNEFNLWQTNPIDKNNLLIEFDYLPDGSDYHSDQIQFFIEYLISSNQIENYIPTNRGKQFAKSRFMQYKVFGLTYYQQLQVLYNDLNKMQEELRVAYADKCKHETLHRENLIRQGYFNNGFVNNEPFKNNDINDCFRFRVETRPYQGNILQHEPEDENMTSVYGYEDRYNMYYRFQMDFYDTFDSQPNNLPLRDILFVGDDQSDDSRILAAIDDADMSARTTPHSYFDTEESNGIYSANELSLQFGATFPLKKSLLPGKLPADYVPMPWRNKPIESQYFEHLYFWRVAPYNVLYRPVLETQQGVFSKPELVNSTVVNGTTHNIFQTNISLQFHSDEITECYAESDCGNPTGEKYFLWVATNKLNKPEWIKNVDSGAFNSNLKPYDNINFDRLDRAEVIFLTDRPRGLTENDKLYYIEDKLGNYDTNWIPYNVNRIKPHVVKIDNQYLLFSHKSTGIRHVAPGKPYDANVITLSRGFANDIFGEEAICFPKFSFQSPNQIIKDALSFENPSLIKVSESVWRIYFNILFYADDNFYTELYFAESEDLQNWDNFTQVKIYSEEDNLLNNVGDVNIIEYDGKLIMFAIYPSANNVPSIHQWQSEDGGLTFIYIDTAYEDLYHCSSPSAIIDENDSLKLYFTMSSSDNQSAMIFSIKYENQSWGYPIVEKGEGEQEEFNGVWINDKYENPFVLYDSDNGHKVKRIYYNYIDNATIYDLDNTQVLTDKATDIIIKTEYLEKYQWTKIATNDNLDYNSKIGNIQIEPVQFRYGDDSWQKLTWQNDSEDRRYPANEWSETRFTFVLSDDEIFACKVSTGAVNHRITCLSQGQWLDFYNVKDTDATLRPELQTDENYRLEDYTLDRYIIKHNLSAEFNQWLNNQTPTDKLKIEFLLNIGHYPEYLKYSRQGMGVYRHLNIVDELNYDDR